MVKITLYLITLIISIWALESINITGIFKKDRYYQSRVLFIMISMALSYLVVNFIYDFLTLKVI
ncbi:MAG: DUF1146 domain-containing protein [Bacilli bacterium]|nr:DUF1146 domain-containing protein [Bacilli bacterium]MBR3209020.1 DUF1146 domain-containing protein [Bacilli bacterium]